MTATEPRSRTSKSPKGKQTEQLLKEAARRVIARDGYLNARVSDVAEEAGVSSASFYNYFENKRSLLEALLRDFQARILDLRTTHRPEGVRGIRGAVAAFWYAYVDFRAELVGVTHAAAVESDFVGIWMDVRNVGVGSIVPAVVAAQAAGEFRDDLDPKVVASCLSSMMEHTCYLWTGMHSEGVGRPESDEQAIDTLTYLFERMLGPQASSGGSDSGR